MPFIAAVSTIEFPHKVEQVKVKEYVRSLFNNLPHMDRLITAFDNTEIITRNFCQPIDYYAHLKTFEEHNNEYLKITHEYSVKAAEACIAQAGIQREDITDIIFVSTTGLATPSMDALIVNTMRLNQNINRMPVWGLGCAGGVGGVSKANMIAKANPKAVVLFIAAELCSLTFIRNDYSKSNFIGTSLFSDGIAACIVKGDAHQPQQQVNIVGSGSKLYYESLDIMGWDFMDSGFKVLFSKDIPALITSNILEDATQFLQQYGLTLSDIKNFIFHPGGTKVLQAYREALTLDKVNLDKTHRTMNEYGNMSSATVMYVLEKFLREGYEDGYGLMLAMGPGFSSEMVLLDMKTPTPKGEML